MGSTSRNALTLMQGTVDLLILRALQHESPSHGYAVSRFVRARTDGVLALEDAALYQALHRLEARGWVDSEWGLSENNRRAKFYRLTADGNRRLKSEASTWRKYASAIFRVLDDPGEAR
jgi:PadR family transcriptional regulator, regulatory protein PadR